MYTYKHIILYRLKWSLLLTSLFMNTLLCLSQFVYKLNLNLGFNMTYLINMPTKTFFFSRTQSIHKYLYLFIALVVGDFLWCRGNIKPLLYVMYNNVLTKKKSTDKIIFFIKKIFY